MIKFGLRSLVNHPKRRKNGSNFTTCGASNRLFFMVFSDISSGELFDIDYLGKLYIIQLACKYVLLFMFTASMSV